MLYLPSLNPLPPGEGEVGLFTKSSKEDITAIEQMLKSMIKYLKKPLDPWTLEFQDPYLS